MHVELDRAIESRKSGTKVYNALEPEPDALLRCGLRLIHARFGFVFVLAVSMDAVDDIHY